VGEEAAKVGKRLNKFYFQTFGSVSLPASSPNSISGPLPEKSLLSFWSNIHNSAPLVVLFTS
jgi:hypothetical protein